MDDLTRDLRQARFATFGCTPDLIRIYAPSQKAFESVPICSDMDQFIKDSFAQLCSKNIDEASQGVYALLGNELPGGAISLYLQPDYFERCMDLLETNTPIVEMVVSLFVKMSTNFRDSFNSDFNILQIEPPLLSNLCASSDRFWSVFPNLFLCPNFRISSRICALFTNCLQNPHFQQAALEHNIQGFFISLVDPYGVLPNPAKVFLSPSDEEAPEETQKDVISEKNKGSISEKFENSEENEGESDSDSNAIETNPELIKCVANCLCALSYGLNEDQRLPILLALVKLASDILSVDANSIATFDGNSPSDIQRKMRNQIIKYFITDQDEDEIATNITLLQVIKEYGFVHTLVSCFNESDKVVISTLRILVALVLDDQLVENLAMYGVPSEVGKLFSNKTNDDILYYSSKFAQRWASVAPDRISLIFDYYDFPRVIGSSGTFAKIAATKAFAAVIYQADSDKIQELMPPELISIFGELLDFNDPQVALVILDMFLKIMEKLDQETQQTFAEMIATEIPESVFEELIDEAPEELAEIAELMVSCIHTVLCLDED